MLLGPGFLQSSDRLVRVHPGLPQGWRLIPIAVISQCVPACVVVLGLLAGMPARAQTESSSQISTEIGFGYESQTTALVRLSPQGELINIDGLQRLGGSHARLGIQGHAHWQLGEGLGLSLSADASSKRAPGASDFDFSMISFQPEAHLAIPSGSLGWGLTLQRMEVAGRPFRDVTGTQVNWTRVEDSGSMWSAVADITSNRHQEYTDLDATGTSLSLQRHWAKPVRGLESIDLALYLSRERNSQGLDELSYRNVMLSASMQWQFLNLTWSAGTSLQKIQFDDTAFGDSVGRVDHSAGFELSAEHELSSSSALRLEYSAVRSTSTIALYDNAYQQIAVKVRTAW